MFAGIVERLVAVKGIEPNGDGKKLHVEVGKDVAEDTRTGDSISINGTCLTVIETGGSIATFELMPETLSRTNLGLLKRGDKVNIERSMKMSDRNHGHFVMGHVDGIGKVSKKEDFGRFSKVWVSCEKKLTGYIAEKGSVAVDGISLTVVDVGKNKFSVALIPHTLEITTLGFKDKGDLVNIEIDMLARYVKNILSGQNSK